MSKKDLEIGSASVKKKKPFFLRWWFILLAIIVVLIIAVSINDMGEKIEWENIALGEMLPEPPNDRGEIHSDDADYLRVDIESISEKEFKEYKKACIDAGYTIDSDDNGDRYYAFNADGFELQLYFYKSDDEIAINLNAPEKLEEFVWPTNDLVARLPVPVSKMAKVMLDTSNSFQVIIGNTTITDYNNYIKACEQKGFIVDFFKNEKSYEAKDAEGYRLNVRYVGCNRINIMMQTPKEETVDILDSSENNTTTSNEVDPDFKSAMDSYEKFMNDYVEFMKKYNKNPGDLSLVADYADFMSDYADYVEDFSEWEDEDLNDAELAYYLDVQTRVSKKLLEVAQ